MADSDLFKQLKLLDPDLARVYFNLTRDDPKAVIDQDGVSQIFGQALDKDNAITKKELDAIILIVQNCNFDQDAIKFELMAITDAVVMEALGKGVGTRLKTDTELADVYKALDLAANSVSFKSPGTSISYDASKYKAVRKLVADGDIIVIAVKDGGIVFGNIRPKGAPAAGAFAAYNPSTDPPTVFMFEGGPSVGRLATIAHEFTHGVQDFVNDPSPVKYRETDAFLAQALTFIKETGKAIQKSNPFAGLAEMVLSGKATAANKDWTKAYEDVATVVGGDPLNARPHAKAVKGKERLQKMTQILKAVDQAQAKPAAKPAK